MVKSPDLRSTMTYAPLSLRSGGPGTSSLPAARISSGSPTSRHYDITEHRTTTQGKLYLCAVKEGRSRGQRNTFIRRLSWRFLGTTGASHFRCF